MLSERATSGMGVRDVALTLRNDEEEFSAFYRENYATIVRLVRPLARDAAKDVAQEAFAVLHQRWTQVSRFDVPWAWVAMVAKRMATRRRDRDTIRVRLHQRVAVSDWGATSEPDVVVALEAIPDRQASALALHYVLDRPLSEVADTLGCNVATARVFLHRSRRRVAERLAGYAGRWVSEASWTTDAIVAHLREHGSGQHVEVVVDKHLERRGGRWELTLADGRYRLFRDDGLRLDEGSFVLGREGLVFAPILAPGRVTFRTVVDGDRLEARLVGSTTPPTDGVPDDVWMRLFVGTAPFTWCGPSGSPM